MEQILFISDQYEFIKKCLPKLYHSKREAMLLGNRKLPVFVKVLFP